MKKSLPFTAILTQPVTSLDSLSRNLNDVGIKTLRYPLIELSEPLTWNSIDATWKKLREYSCVIFASPYAVRTTLNRWWHISKGENDENLVFSVRESRGKTDFIWHDNLLRRFPPIGLMGPSSYLLCCALGLRKCRFLLPKTLDVSDGINLPYSNKGSKFLWTVIENFLKMEIFSKNRAIRFAFIKGSNGNRWLINRLMKFGIQVDEIICYRRRFLDWSDEIWRIIRELIYVSPLHQIRHLDDVMKKRVGFFFTSSDAINHFIASTSKVDPGGLLISYLRDMPCVVTQMRAAEEAKRNNFQNIQLCSASINSVCQTFLYCEKFLL